jgi:hypothetical protein
MICRLSSCASVRWRVLASSADKSRRVGNCAGTSLDRGSLDITSATSEKERVRVERHRDLRGGGSKYFFLDRQASMEIAVGFLHAAEVPFDAGHHVQRLRGHSIVGSNGSLVDRQRPRGCAQSRFETPLFPLRLGKTFDAPDQRRMCGAVRLLKVRHSRQ